MNYDESEPHWDRGQKTCQGNCGRDLPATADYFDRDATRDDGLRSICKECRANERLLAKQDALDDRIKILDEKSVQMIELLTRTGSDLPHIAEVYQRVMEVYEGAGGFAAHFMAQYLSCKPGSTTRTKMLELVVRLSTKVSESGAAQIPLELMTDEDLQVAFEKGVKRYIPRIVHDNGEAKEAC
jgi:hypothetical protein